MKEDIEEIKKLKQCERYIIPESDYGKAEVYKINSVYVLFSIPMYGGEPAFEKVCFSPEEAVNIAYSWT